MRPDGNSTDEAPDAWVRAAVSACVAQCERLAPRLARRLRRQRRCRDPSDDALALAARRVLPLPRRVLRPLPGATLPLCARAFNALDPADRRALLERLGERPPAVPASDGGDPALRARREHLASALSRLVAGTRALESRELARRAHGTSRAAPRARGRARKELRPSP